MTNWFANAIARITSLLNGLQAKQFLAVVLAGFLVLTTNMNHETSGRGNNNAMTNKVLERVHENDSPRPKTVGEWKKDARETANDPDERGRRISEQSGAAFKEFGSGYAEAMKNATEDAKDSVVRTGSNVADRVAR